MGKFIYDGIANAVDIEDRALAHLRIVFMNKLRRNEPFMFEVSTPHGNGRRDLWIHPAVSMQFHFSGSRPPQVNPAWIERLMESASSADGLRLVPEPQG